MVAAQQEMMQWFAHNRGRVEVRMTTMRSGKMGTMVGAQGLERVEMLARSSSSEWAELAEQRNRPQKKGREVEDNKEDEVAKCWNCTRRMFECIWPR